MPDEVEVAAEELQNAIDNLTSTLHSLQEDEEEETAEVEDEFEGDAATTAWETTTSVDSPFLSPSPLILQSGDNKIDVFEAIENLQKAILKLENRMNRLENSTKPKRMLRYAKEVIENDSD